jgi:O-antigen ligase
MLIGSALGLLLSVSSAALGGTIIGFGALLYNKIMGNFPFRWGLVLASAVVVTIIVFTALPSPLEFILNHVTFDHETAYYRLLQWEYAGPLIMTSPILGLGAADAEWMDEWAHSSGLAKTIDSTWLLMALQFGLPGSILIILSYITPCSLSTDIGNKSLNLTKQERQLSFVLSLILGLVIYIGFTVDYWGSVFLLIMFLAGIRAHLGALGAMPREAGLDDDE